MLGETRKTSIISCIMGFVMMAVILEPADAGAASVTLAALLEPSANHFLASLGYYDITKFVFSTDDRSICSSSKCIYSLEKGHFEPNILTRGFLLVGDLKVSVPTAQGIQSRFYHMWTPLNKIGSTAYKNGTETYMLSGTVGVGGAPFGPAQFSYDVQNATLVVVNNQSRTIGIKAQN